jgi:hypothetical protein
LGGSNKTCTFKIWYESETLKKKTYIKVQINFVEEMCQKPRKGQLKSLLTASTNKELACNYCALSYGGYYEPAGPYATENKPWTTVRDNGHGDSPVRDIAA